jgi:hypothetical protein
MKTSKKQMRIAIAKDVLKQIKARKIKATPGEYLTINNVNGTVGTATELLTKAKTCNVCALGSLFMADTLLRDKVDDRLHVSHNAWCDTTELRGPGCYSMREELGDFFSEEQLHLIENAFEKETIEAPDYASMSSVEFNLNASNRFFDRNERAIKFGKKHRSPTKRLVSIMNNVIRHEGTFKP